MGKRTTNVRKLQEFELYLREEERSEATVEKYLRDVRGFLDFAGEAAPSKQTVLEYKSKLGSSYAVASANSMLAAVNSFLRFCGRQELCIKRFKVQRQAFCSEDRELTRAEYLRLLDAARESKNERLYLILQTICATGIRVSELRFITMEAVQRGEAVVNCKGKNRRIFIVSELKKRLLHYAKKQKRRFGAVFVTKSGKHVSRNNIWKEMKALCARARVAPSKVFPHNLRHLFARTFYDMEKDIVKLADVLGHASINTTRIYTVQTGAEHRRQLEHMRLIV